MKKPVLMAHSPEKLTLHWQRKLKAKKMKHEQNNIPDDAVVKKLT